MKIQNCKECEFYYEKILTEEEMENGSGSYNYCKITTAEYFPSLKYIEECPFNIAKRKKIPIPKTKEELESLTINFLRGCI